MKITMNGKRYDARQDDDGRVQFKDESGAWQYLPLGKTGIALELEDTHLDYSRGDKGIQL